METPNIVIIENFINDADSMFAEIRDRVNWDERMKARRTASFGVSYNYSGMIYPETTMMKCLIPVCDQIESKIGFRPNNCLMNYYLDGNSTMGYHSDSAEELQEGTGVAIISLGAARSISYRSKLDIDRKVKYRLKNGALLYMDNDVQTKWMHAILKEKGVGERISLTFRNIIK